MPPKKLTIKYPAPKAEGGKVRQAEILARAWCIEQFKNGRRIVYYFRFLDLVNWHYRGHRDHKELRFAYYYFTERCKKKPTINQAGWRYGQGAGQMKPKTFVELIKKAKTKPDYGDFLNSLDRIQISKSSVF